MMSDGYWNEILTLIEYNFNIRHDENQEKPERQSHAATWQHGDDVDVRSVKRKQENVIQWSRSARTKMVASVSLKMIL